MNAQETTVANSLLSDIEQVMGDPVARYKAIERYAAFVDAVNHREFAEFIQREPAKVGKPSIWSRLFN